MTCENLKDGYCSVVKDYILNEPSARIHCSNCKKFKEGNISGLNFNRIKICMKLGMNPDKKIIMMATQPFPSKKAREIFTKSVVSSFKKIKDIQLIIKVHPEEKISYYKKLLDYKEDIFITKHNIFETIFISDAVLVVYSTVGIEAAILDKPIVNLTYIDDISPVDYIEKGIAFKADNLNELTKQIKKALYNKRAKNKLEKNRKKYVYEHSYKVDGNAIKRIVKEIDKLCR